MVYKYGLKNNVEHQMLPETVDRRIEQGSLAGRLQNSTLQLCRAALATAPHSYVLTLTYQRTGAEGGGRTHLLLALVI